MLTQYFLLYDQLALRVWLSALTALLLGFNLGIVLIPLLKQFKLNQVIHHQVPENHTKKAGTPTMGGILIVFSIFGASFLWGDLSNRWLWLILLIMLSFGAIGFVDDYRKIKRNDNSRGMGEAEKFLWQSIIALVAAGYLAFALIQNAFPASSWLSTIANMPLKINLPFSLEFAYPGGILGFIIFSYFVIVGSSNAVNLTDGLDGLAIMPVVMVGSALGLLAYHAYTPAGHLPIVASEELSVIAAAIAGSGLAFLWFNCHPAKIFMGDLGALPLGAALGGMAIILRQEAMLFVMGGIFVVETLSVIVQRIWFKYTKWRFGTGRRLLKMAPLHHHFELSQWPETQIVIRFWLTTLILIMVVFLMLAWPQ